MSLSIDTLTLGEVAKVEELSRQSITTIANDDTPKGLALAALVFVFKRRQDASFKWDDALNTNAAEANELLGLTSEDGEEPDPLEQPSTSSPATSRAKKK